jgi:hypothetical protein
MKPLVSIYFIFTKSMFQHYMKIIIKTVMSHYISDHNNTSKLSVKSQTSKHKYGRRGQINMSYMIFFHTDYDLILPRSLPDI